MHCGRLRRRRRTQNGVACLVSCPQEDAEKYCEGLRLNGLISTIEPQGGGGGGNGNGGPEAS